MGIAPKQILEEQERLEREIFGQQEDSTENTVDDTAPEQAPATPEAEAAPQQALNPEPEAAPDDQPQKGIDYFKQRYEVINGKYKAETRALREENAQLSERLASLEEALEAAQPQGKELGDILTPEEHELEDVAEMADKIVKQRLEEDRALIRKTYEAEIATLKQQLGELRSDQSATQEDALYRSLETAVPDWERVNTSKEFISWLGETDPFSGATRQQLLDNAAQYGDTDRVIAFFKTFKADSGKQTAVVPSLDSQVTPPPSGGAQGEANSGPTMTLSEHTRLTNAMVRGDVPWEETKKKLEAAEQAGFLPE